MYLLLTLLQHSLETFTKTIASLHTSHLLEQKVQESFITRFWKSLILWDKEMAFLCCASPLESHTKQTQSTLQLASQINLLRYDRKNFQVEKHDSILENELYNIVKQGDNRDLLKRYILGRRAHKRKRLENDNNYTTKQSEPSFETSMAIYQFKSRSLTSKKDDSSLSISVDKKKRPFRDVTNISNHKCSTDKGTFQRLTKKIKAQNCEKPISTKLHKSQTNIQPMPGQLLSEESNEMKKGPLQRLLFVKDGIVDLKKEVETIKGEKIELQNAYETSKSKVITLEKSNESLRQRQSKVIRLLKQKEQSILTLQNIKTEYEENIDKICTKVNLVVTNELIQHNNKQDESTEFVVKYNEEHFKNIYKKIQLSEALANKMSQSEDKLFTLTAEYEMMKNQKEAFEVKCDHLDNTIEMLVSEKKKLHDQISMISDDQDNSTSELTRMTGELKSKEEMIRQYEDDKNELKNQLTELHLKIALAESLASRMSESDDKLHILTCQFEEMENEKRGFEMKCTSLEKSIEMLEVQRNRLEDIISSMTNECASVNEELRNVRQDVDMKDEEIVKLKKEHIATQTYIDQLRDEKELAETLAGNMSSADDKLICLTSEYEMLKSQKDAVDAKCTNLCERITTLSRSSDQLKLELYLSNKEHSLLNGEFCKTVEQLDLNKAIIKELREGKVSLEAEVKGLKHMNESLKKNAAALEKKNAVLTIENMTMEEQLSDSSGDCLKFQNELSVLKKATETKNELVAKLQGELVSSQNHVEKLLTNAKIFEGKCISLEEMRVEMKDLKNKLQLMQCSNDELKQKCHKLQGTINNLEFENNSRETNLKLTLSKLSSSVEEGYNLKNDLLEKSNELLDLQRENESMNSQLQGLHDKVRHSENLQNEVLESQRNAKFMSNQLREIQSKNEILEKEIIAQDNSKKILVSERKKIESELCSIQKLYESKDNEMKTLTNDFEKKNEHIESLETTVSLQEERCDTLEAKVESLLLEKAQLEDQVKSLKSNIGNHLVGDCVSRDLDTKVETANVKTRVRKLRDSLASNHEHVDENLVQCQKLVDKIHAGGEDLIDTLKVIELKLLLRFWFQDPIYKTKGKKSKDFKAALRKHMYRNKDSDIACYFVPSG